MDINEYISTRLDPQIEWYDKNQCMLKEDISNFR